MRYYLTKLLLGRFPKIAIEEERFISLKDARNSLISALAIEANYEILISNYLDFEKQLLDFSTEHMMRRKRDYLDFFELRLALNVRVVNLLTSARLYLDHLKHHVQNLLPNSAVVNVTISKEYDNNFEYRFMEALRNYVQHRGLPIHWMQLRSSRLEEDLEYTIELSTLREHLSEDSRFKKKVLDEMGKQTDLKASTRCYVECLSNIHDAVRQMIADPVKAARDLIEPAHREYKEVRKYGKKVWMV